MSWKVEGLGWVSLERLRAVNKVVVSEMRAWRSVCPDLKEFDDRMDWKFLVLTQRAKVSPS
jgi:hypothetical protein